MTRVILLVLFFVPRVWCADAAKLRLDDNVRPVRYAVDLKLMADRPDFTGSIEIDIDVERPSPIVLLNAREIKVLTATINGKAATVEAGNSDVIGLHPASGLSAGPAKLRIEYAGKISPKNTEGIFQGRDGNNLYLFTQFESIDARRAFPCFDQPDYKTPWQVTLHVKRGEKAFANTPQVSETPEPDGMKKVVFAPTKPLPSYLVAFAVGPFEVVEAGKAGRNRVPVRIITPKGLAYQAKYAAQITATLVDRLEDYFGIPYPYEKIDNIAIPLTYGFGAMENAGLVTYEQSILLANPAIDTEQRQRLYASDAAHELAHQWFGDLVTLAWWDDTWLNEAFATWMSSKILAGWKPEWQTRIDDLGPKFGAMSEDSLVATRKIHQPIETADDIENAFDDITYEKGSAVIRMFESWVGEKQFQSGVTAYLKQYSYKNARMADFLDAIAGAGQPRLTSAFTTFLDQPGFPEISVEVKCSGAPSVALTQKRYLPVGSGGSHDEVWQVPVCVRYKTGNEVQQECFLLDKPSAEFRLTKATACPSILWANDHASGYYVDAYSGDLRAKLIGQGAGFLEPAEQVTLVNDLARLASAGDVKESVALDAVPAYGNSNHREVVTQTEDILIAVRPLVPANLRENYARFVRKVYGDRARALGWSPKPADDVDTKLLRRSLLQFVASDGEDNALQAEARRLADGWLRDRKGIDSSMLGDVLAAAALSGDRAYFDRLLEELAKTRDLRQRRALIDALGSFRNPSLVDAAHQLVIHSEIDGRESGRLLYAGTDDPATEDMAFQFVKANYAEVVKHLPSGGGSDAGAKLPGVIAGCDARAEEELKFFEERAKDFAGGPRTFQQVKERVKLCGARQAAMGEDVAGFFAKQ